jgi:outer membrane protein TolC
MFRRLTIIIILLNQVIASNAQISSLDDFIRAGIAGSPLLKDMNNQIRMNSADSLIIKANTLPRINFSGLMMYAPVINDYGYSEAITNGGNLISTVSVSQNIFNKKTFEAQYSKLGLQNQSVNNSIIRSEKDLKKAITDQYLDAYESSVVIGFGQSLLNSSKNEEALLRQMVEKGIYHQTDYLAFLVELQTLELELINLQTQYRKTLSNLCLLAGVSDTGTVELSLPDLHPAVPKNQLSPFFHRFRIDSLQLLNEKTIIDRSYKPVISWMTDAGLVNNDPTLIYKNLGLSIGISMTFPIYDGNQRQLSYRKLQISEETRKGYEDYFRQQYDGHLLQLNDELKRTKEIVPRLKQQYALAESIVRQDKELLNIGGFSVTDFVIAVKNLVTIKQNLNQYEIKVLRLINEINYWEE